MGVEAGYKLHDRVEGDVEYDRTREKSNGTKTYTKGRTRVCVCVLCAGLAHILL